jgi:hypothetical protein
MTRAAYQRARRIAARTRGDCVVCCCRPAIADQVQCEPCRDRQRVRNRARMQALLATGRCLECTGPTLEGFSCCAGCLDWRAERAAKRRQQLRADYERAMEAA